MKKVRKTLNVDVEFYIDDEYGPTYVATNSKISLVTDGHSFEELLKNLKEAIGVSLEDTDTVAESNLISNPRVVITMPLSDEQRRCA